MKNKSAIMQTYRRSELSFVAGDGVWLETAAGERYLDFGSGVAVNILGHRHPKLVAALEAQAQKLWHVSNLYTIAEQEALAQKLCAASGFGEQVFFCNSGAEAVEGAIKMMRKFHAETNPQRTSKRNEIISFSGAFHGRTLATLATLGEDEKSVGFGPLPAGFVQCDGFDIDKLKKLITANTAGILLEPIQGEGGVREVPRQFLVAVRELCDEHGILLALDEVQCGMGRTGKLFAFQHCEIQPDIIALAKGLGGGMPIGAVVATAAVGAAMTAGSHGSTFGGNPLAMAVASAVLDEVMLPEFLAAVEAQGLYLRQQLAGLVDSYPDLLEEVRGVGLMLGLKIKTDTQTFVAALAAEKLLSVAAAENVVRLLPPLIVTQDEIRQAVAAIDSACKKLTKGEN